MSEGKAGANGALRVEFSTFPWFTWGSAQARETAFLGEFTASSTWGCSAQARGTNFQGSLHQALRVGSAQTPGQAEPVFTRPRVLRFRQGPARLLIASRPNAPLRGLNVGFVAIASAALRTEASQCVRVEEGRLFPGDYIDITTLDHFLYLSWF